MDHQLETPAIELRKLHRRFGRVDALRGLDLRAETGRCHGLFGRNGAGKTTAILCMLNQLRPTTGDVRVLGLDPARRELEVKERIAYVPDSPNFFPWMTVRDTLDYFASFRRRWDRDLERKLLRDRFELDLAQKAQSLSRGMKAQLALACALCASPELLILDEPISGLDPLVRRELLETVIGDFLAAREGRTVFIATHLIREVEGLIDAFTVVEDGRAGLQEDAQSARERFRTIRLEFDHEPPPIEIPDVTESDRMGRLVELVTSHFSDETREMLEALSPASLETRGLSLEEIFVHSTREARQGQAS